MNNIKQSFLSGLIFLGTILTGFIGFAAYTSLPTQNTGDTINQSIWNNLINKVNDIGTQVDNGGLGLNQTRQDVTSSRVAGTTYTNNTGKPIIISTEAGNTSTYMGVSLIINLIEVQRYRISGFSSNTVKQSVYGIVPPGGTYKIVTENSNILVWNELR